MDLARSAKVMMSVVVVVVVVVFDDIIIPNGNASLERVVEKTAARKQQHSKNVARAITLVPPIMLLVAFLRFCAVPKELLFAGKRHVVSCATDVVSSSIFEANTIALHDERSLYLSATGIVLLWYLDIEESLTQAGGLIEDILRIRRGSFQETASSQRRAVSSL
jgi:hypothetical protein